MPSKRRSRNVRKASRRRSARPRKASRRRSARPRKASRRRSARPRKAPARRSGAAPSIKINDAHQPASSGRVYQTVTYFLKNQNGSDTYIPSNQEMNVIMKDIQGMLTHMLNGRCSIFSRDGNVITFLCEKSVFDDYGESVLLHPDDDGNYYIERKNENGVAMQLGWYAKK